MSIFDSLVFYSPTAHAADAYRASNTYSPITQAQMEAAREKRKEEARKRIHQAIYGSDAAPAGVTPKPLMPSAAPPAPTERQPIVLPPPTPITVQAKPPVPPVMTATSPAPPPLPVVPVVEVPAEIKLPPPPATQAPESLPWHNLEEGPPPASVADTSVAPEESPAQTPPKVEGVIADKTYIIAPGAPPPPPPAPLVAVPVTEPPATMSEQPLPEVLAAIEAAKLAQEETLSPETEEILDALPEDIIGRIEKPAPGDVNVDRMDPSKAVPDLSATGETASGSESLGMNVAVKKRPVDVNYELEKAYIALSGGNTEEAIAFYKNVLEIDPANEQALFGLATTYHRVGLLDEARPIYGKLLKINPRHKDAINNFLVLVGEEAPERALEHMKHLESENPEFAPIPAQMALLYTKLGKMDSAISSMQRAVNISPENLVYKYNLAILYDQAGKPVEASILYQQLLEARYRGETIPADADEIQQRLTFLLSNR